MTYNTFDYNKLVDFIERSIHPKEQNLLLLQKEISQVNISFSVHKFITIGKELSNLASEQATLKEIRLILINRGGDSDATIRDLEALLNLESVSKWLNKDYVNNFIQDLTYSPP